MRSLFSGAIIDMDQQSHVVTGIYASRAEAETTREQLVKKGLARQLLTLVEN